MKTQIVILCVFITITFNGIVRAQTYSNNDYLIDSLKIGDSKMEYGLLKPIKQEKNKKYPLILALHGAEWTDPEFFTVNKMLNEGDWPIDFYIATNLAKENIRKKYPTYVLAPHHVIKRERDTALIDRLWYRKKNIVILDSLITSLLKHEQVDPNRIYVTGHSIGGDGTFNMPFKLKYPIAAIAPMAAATISQDSIIRYLKDNLYNNIPIWSFDHYRDSESPIDRRQFYRTLDSLGHSTIYTHAFDETNYFLEEAEIQNKINNRHRYLYTEYHKQPSIGMAHYIMEFASADTLFYNWLFDQYLIDEDAIHITNLSSEDYKLTWAIRNPSDTVEIWFREDNDWELVDKGIYTHNEIVLTDYINENKLQQGYIRVASINQEGYMYGKDELRLPDDTSASFALFKKEIKIFPNPVRDQITISSESFQKGQILDLSGRLMLESNHSVINVSSLPHGTYIIKIYNNNHRSYSKKIILHD